MNKILIIDVSPKCNGNTAKMVKNFKEHVKGDITHISLFNKEGMVSPCIDCGGCHHVQGCVIKDSFQNIVADEYDVVVLASPIYMSNLPAPAFSLLSRFNYLYNNKIHLGITPTLKEKRGILFLVGGGSACKALQGESNEDLPIRQAKYILKKLNAQLDEKDMVLCLDTDTLPVQDNVEVINKITALAASVGE